MRREGESRIEVFGEQRVVVPRDDVEERVDWGYQHESYRCALRKEGHRGAGVCHVGFGHSRPSDASSASWNRPGSNHETLRRPDSIDRTAPRFETRSSSYASTSPVDCMMREEGYERVDEGSMRVRVEPGRELTGYQGVSRAAGSRQSSTWFSQRLVEMYPILCIPERKRQSPRALRIHSTLLFLRMHEMGGFGSKEDGSKPLNLVATKSPMLWFVTQRFPTFHSTTSTVALHHIPARLLPLLHRLTTCTMAKSTNTVTSSKSAKSKAKPAPASNAAGPSKPTDASSIDDIFAKPSKPSVKATTTTATPSSSTSLKGKSKASSISGSSALAAVDEARKKKQIKNKVAASLDPSAPAPTTASTKSRVVEVVDPSLPQPKEKAAPAAAVKSSKKRDRKEEEEDEIFRDSRGDGPSKCSAYYALITSLTSRTED
jgi:hypothetical protein